MIVYTDGSCHNNGQCAVDANSSIFYGPADARNKVIPMTFPPFTNNRAELWGIIVALMDNPHCELEIRTDSKYSIDMSANPLRDDIKNQDLWQLYHRTVVERRFGHRLVHVPGHKGISGNVAADKLANRAFYAVKVGRIPGIYFDWDIAKSHVEKFPGAIYKKFKTYADAHKFLSD